ncbi:uncharacterized protein N7477_006405 [Penicillium maclennaniae]|uniref:uncharacterized protein n=1 Tax=Penicillium maclennaniae TaxID=1343394 RepID=UPI00254091F1|nr:uncharacterized protein N7477_006405 [Penicillium maclennaniae]KAJ5667835.1 hypothetical protein N7477_006405 [Penicillium maclennaniae]
MQGSLCKLQGRRFPAKCLKLFSFSLLITSLALWGQVANAAFGLTTTTDSYVVDAGSSNPLKFTVNHNNCDISSINCYGSELQYQSTGSHIGSGLGTATVSATTTSEQSLNHARDRRMIKIGDYIKITCKTDTLIHYYVVYLGDPIIYMATYTSAEPSIGELRYIARLNADLLPNEEPFGDVSKLDGGTAIEGSDVTSHAYGGEFLVDGETRSKFYSSDRFIDDHRHLPIRVCMIINQYETGGWRTIPSNSGHVQTESYRQGLHGPYLMYFSRSGTPSTDIDTSFFADLNIEGYVATSGRGYVKGTASGADDSLDWVVHWYNDAAQYWTYTSSSGSFTSPAMKPGTYTMVYYQGEYVVATSSVKITAGSTTSKNISGSMNTGTTIFKIERPAGFRNAANQLRMHPSDNRMSSWSPGTYKRLSYGNFKSVNSPLTISFTTTSSQTGAATLRIGTTLSFAGGRPQATVNSYKGSIPSAPTDLSSRGVTRGAYRGLGEIYDVSIPVRTIVAGTNTVMGYLPRILDQCINGFRSPSLSSPVARGIRIHVATSRPLFDK